MPFYGVYKGAPNQGQVYTEWGTAEKAMRGCAGVRVKKYNNLADATQFAASGDYSIETPIPSRPPEVLDVYTDGSYTSSNGKGGVGVFFPEFPAWNVSERFTIAPITSQRAELYAIVRALQVIKTAAVPGSKKLINLWTDSRYAYGCACEWKNKWKATNFRQGTIQNTDLILQIWSETAANSRPVQWFWVRSHNGTPGNEQADTLATTGGKKNA